MTSVLAPLGNTVVAAVTGEAALERVRTLEVDAVLIHSRHPDAHALNVCRRLRAAPQVEATVPVVMIFDEILHRDQHMEALRAGAWECLTPPVDAEQLAVKLETFIAARQSAARAREHVLLDQATGFYNVQGILRWVRELGSAAQRYGRPLGCAVFGLRSADREDAKHPSADLAISMAEMLSARARSSDILGRLNRSEFVVLTPDTDPAGVLSMANRFVGERRRAETVRDDAHPQICAGCYAVADFASTQLEPVDIIMCATMALRRAQMGSGPLVELSQLPAAG